MSQPEPTELTAAERSRIERNRNKALTLRQAKLIAHPYAAAGKKSELLEASFDNGPAVGNVIKMHGSKFVDSGGGFLVEQQIVPTNAEVKSKDAAAASEKKQVVEAISIPVSYEECLECGDQFVDSYLLNSFAYAVCDKCRDADGKHSLITRSEAKAEYLLKDCDFDRREPKLRYISRKNPHNVRWGEMKLYLHLQVEQRAMEVWGSEEELQKQHEERDEKREVYKVRKYNKKMTELRMEMRSSLFKKKTHESHVHEFGPDTYNEAEDNYTHSCLHCTYTETYEKL